MAGRSTQPSNRGNSVVECRLSCCIPAGFGGKKTSQNILSASLSVVFPLLARESGQQARLSQFESLQNNSKPNNFLVLIRMDILLKEYAFYGILFLCGTLSQHLNLQHGLMRSTRMLKWTFVKNCESLKSLGQG